MRNCKINRFELNRVIRRVLVRHRIDLKSLTFYSFNSYIEFHGLLLKSDGCDVSLSEAKSLIQELKNIKSDAFFHFSNWHITNNQIKMTDL